MVHVLPGVFGRTLNKEYRMLNAKRKHQEKALVFLNCFLIFVNQLCLPRQRFIILNAILCLTLAQDLEMTSFTIHMETISFIDTSGNYFYNFIIIIIIIINNFVALRLWRLGV